MNSGANPVAFVSNYPYSYKQPTFDLEQDLVSTVASFYQSRLAFTPRGSGVLSV